MSSNLFPDQVDTKTQDALEFYSNFCLLDIKYNLDEDRNIVVKVMVKTVFAPGCSNISSPCTKIIDLNVKH